MTSTDRFDTPLWLAERMVALVSTRTPSVVADFAAGDGRLLRAAADAWPEATLVALDVDAATVAGLRGGAVAIDAGRCDLLSQRSRAASPVLRRWPRPDVVLLNPPFTDRGGHARYPVAVDGEVVACTRPMAFTLTAAAQLAPGGELVAILPAGVTTSGRDRAGWAALSRAGSVAIEGPHTDSAFSGCRLRTVTVHLVSGPAATQPASVRTAASPPRAEPRGAVVLARGRITMPRAQRLPPGTVRLVHTTDLARRELGPPRGAFAVGDRTVRGPCVLLPRVGRPRCDKIVVFDGAGPIAPTDCVIVVTPRDPDHVTAVAEDLRTDFEVLAGLYTGSCACFITLERLARFLAERGWASRVVYRSGRSATPRGDRGPSVGLDRREDAPPYLPPFREQIPG